MRLAGITIWGLLFSVALAWIFWPRSLDRQGDSLAVITSLQGEVKLRASGSFNWDSLQVGDHLFALDSISTSRMSTATFKLADNTKIKLPEDTQLKIQPQPFTKGISITLARGGIDVEAPASQAVPAKNSPGTLKAKMIYGALPTIPLTVQTSLYHIDLSQLNGSFRLHPQEPMKSSQPDQIKLQNVHGSISLAQLNEAGPQTLEADFAKNIIEIQKPLAAEEPTKDIEELAPSKPKPLHLLKPQAIPPRVKPLAPKPVVHLELVNLEPDSLPNLVAGEFDFYWSHTTAEGMEKPILVSGKDLRSADDPWQAVFRFSIEGNPRNAQIIRPLSAKGLQFKLAELRSILPIKGFDGLNLKIESGVFRKAIEGQEFRFAESALFLRLHSLEKADSLTILLDQWQFKSSDNQWFTLPLSAKKSVALHLWNPTKIFELEGYIRGAQAFSLTSLSPEAAEANIHFVRGQDILLSLGDTDGKIINDLQARLLPNFIYRGRKESFLGTGKSFDIERQLDKYPEIYYLLKSKALKLDRNLFKTQTIARDFINRFDPYFFSSNIEVIYNKKN